MNPFPYMRYYVRDFEHDEHVQAMGTLALGAYHRLLWRAWNQNPVGTLPNDDALLARWAGVTTDEWMRVKPELGPCFRLVRVAGGTRWQQKRMVREYQAIATDKKQRSAAGRKAINARWGTRKELDTGVLRSKNDRNTNTEPDTDHNNNTAARPPPPAVVVVVEPAAAEGGAGTGPDAVVAALLRGAGVADAVADELAWTTTVDRASAVIDSGKARVVSGKCRSNDFAGYVVAAIRKNYPLEPVAAVSRSSKERRRAVAAEAGEKAVKRKSEAELLAEAEQREVARLRALPAEQLASLKADVLAGQSELVQGRLANADPIDNPVLRGLVLKRLADTA